ncbi:dTDP-4-dehydrorhamnose reductase [Sorangium cellulosum]|uniref:dTDP-4-dehydrorhamnose reductase n=1 Tax=Sorangium cellulosum TaxID=56 RepID=A0A2L0EZJ6_SORCE|nr:family 1 glycosylhydrolase [Sorangium cellulosum]AUX44703.1 dTDP-4-dehydrorhamnose reductase [Sorangium cellulosum]
MREHSGIELWGGVECTVNRVGDQYLDQLERTGHLARITDLDLLAELGVKAVRYPVLWERTAPRGVGSADFSWADERLHRLKELGIDVIVGLVHHGSGPLGTSLMEDSFVSGLGEFAGAVAERYPWVRDFTPVNEPLTTARFSALYGHWYPHHHDTGSFLRALLVETRATAAAMRAIRRVRPDARLVQTEDFGAVDSTPELAYQAEFENHRRWLSLDLLAGRVDRAHPLYRYLLDHGVPAAELARLEAEPCPPDVIGVNYYLTSDRFLDHRLEHYPAWTHGGNGRHRYADVEAVRVREEGISGHQHVLREVWQRYQTPIAVTEVHLGCTPEEQIRWLVEAWEAAHAARAEGADVKAITLWSAFGAYDWDSLVTQARGHYEPGVFDVRGPAPRPTAIAAVARELAFTGRTEHPLAAVPGWWRRDERLLYGAPRSSTRTICRPRERPILVTGAGGSLGAALVRACEERGIHVRAVMRSELDIADEAALERVIAEVRPWLVINAARYTRVHEAEDEIEACRRANVVGPTLLAAACQRHASRLLMFSSSFVFDGSKPDPYVEDDPVAPINAYGEAQAQAERSVLDALPSALVVRTGSLFGPFEARSFAALALAVVQRGELFHAADDLFVSPTYLPHLAHTCLDLAIDQAEGVWHLANDGVLSFASWAKLMCDAFGLPSWAVHACPAQSLGLRANLPRQGGLHSRRRATLPTLPEALEHYVKHRADTLLAAG